MADASGFLDQLSQSGVKAQVQTELLGFEFGDFESAWAVLAGVTTANLAPEIQEQARNAVRQLMWKDTGESRYFRNTTQFIVGHS
jgi:hypothetical protein